MKFFGIFKAEQFLALVKEIDLPWRAIGMKRSMLLPASIYLIEAVSSHINSYAIEKHILNKGHYVQDRFVQYR